MNVRSKFWLVDADGEAIFGGGRRRILESIDELGSMQATAKSLGMSYRGVWARIKATEERLGVKLVETSVGRGKDRGSRLTPEARRLLKNYNELTRQGIDHTDELFEVIFEKKKKVQTDAVTPALALVGLPGEKRARYASALVAEWTKRGRKVGIIELAPESRENPSDSEKLFQAGAPTVLKGSSEGFSVHLPAGSKLTPEVMAANYCPGCDLVLVATDNRINLPTIEVFDQSKQESLLTRKPKNLVAIAGDRPEDDKGRPHFPLDDAAGLVERVEKKLRLPEAAADVRLTVDGRKVPMLPFVRDIIAKTVRGLISTLKSCDNPDRIEIVIKDVNSE